MANCVAWYLNRRAVVVYRAVGGWTGRFARPNYGIDQRPQLECQGTGTPQRTNAGDKGGGVVNAINLLVAWLKDVYQRYGWQAVLVCLVIVCALVFAVALFLPPNVQAALYRLVGG